MAGDTIVTIIGNLVDDPELRFLPNGTPVAKFRLASTPRTYNTQTQAYEDGESLFLPCQVWRQAAEHVAESLQKGMRVIVQGRLKQRSYEDREGVKRTVYELEVEEIGPSLRSATAKVTKAASGQGQQAYQRARQQSSQEGREDPWTSPPPAGGGQAAGGWGGAGGYSDEPPF